MATIVGVWGASGGGKTTVSSLLGRALAEAGKNVAVVYCDDITPAIPTILPLETQARPDTMADVKSIGKVISAVSFSENDIYAQCVPDPANKRLALIGYAYTDNSLTYPAPEVEDIYNFYRMLSGLCDYIIVDATVNYRDSILSSVGLELSDIILRVGGADLKSFCYFASQAPIFPVGKVTSVDRHLNIFAISRAGDAAEDALDFYSGHIDSFLPYSDTVFSLSATGELLLKPLPRQYAIALDKLKRLVLEAEGVPPESKDEQSPPAISPQAKETKEPERGEKSRVTAAWLGFFLGLFGVHNFYLKNYFVGATQFLIPVLVSVFAWSIPIILKKPEWTVFTIPAICLSVVAVAIWAAVEVIYLVLGKTDKDGAGDKFRDEILTEQAPGLTREVIPGISKPVSSRSGAVAGVLGLYLGSIGIHNFYLGRTGKGVAQLLISVLTLGIGAIGSGIWALVEVSQLLNGKCIEDGDGAVLREIVANRM